MISTSEKIIKGIVDNREIEGKLAGLMMERMGIDLYEGCVPEEKVAKASKVGQAYTIDFNSVAILKREILNLTTPLQ